MSEGDKNPKYGHTMMILGRKIGENEFEYVSSKSSSTVSELYMDIQDLPEG
jgi:hypothetical protein